MSTRVFDGLTGELRLRAASGADPRGAGGSSLAPEAQAGAPADERSPAADERAPRAPAADEPAPRARAAFDESARVDIDMTANDEDDPVTIKWSYQTHLPRFARLFAERHGEADPTRLKATEIRSLALAMELTDSAAGIHDQAAAQGPQGKGAWQPSSRRLPSPRRWEQPRALSAGAGAGVDAGRGGAGRGREGLQEPRQARP
mmetsp:Transcript_46792/g.109215  ORF Transcript_46792/g.109215 Transcript_46792/m.109215 type:complete len:203 (+) Transcript_46792:92-700(+)